MSKRFRIRIRVLLWWAVLGTTLPLPGMAGICSDVEALKNFSEADKVESSYFDKYFIKKEGGVFYIHCKKRTQLEFSSLKQVMSALEHYPEFMPGYKAINVKREPDGQILTAIRFRASFSPFESRFTNRVEIKDGPELYKQCWQQLEESDARIIEPYKSAPVVNKGYWQLEKKQGDEVDISYFSIIQPPLLIPDWLYIQIVKGTYAEVFQKVVSRVKRSP